MYKKYKLIILNQINSFLSIYNKNYILNSFFCQACSIYFNKNKMRNIWKNI
jgi:hypothetical protein